MKVSNGFKAAFALLALLAILKPINADICFAAAFLFQIYVPMKLGYSPIFSKTELKIELIRVLWVSLVTFSIFIFGYHVFQSSYGAVFHPAFSWGLLWSLVVNVFLIALPEEIFYRGYLQSFSPPFAKGGLGGILGVNLLFALGHFVGEYDPSRLLPFFPGLIFSWFVYRSKGSLTGAVFYHALCNILSEWLAMSYSWSRP